MTLASDPSTTSSHRPLLSIVVPALNEEGNVQPLVEEVLKTVRQQGQIDAELIVVDDGSTDQTLPRLIELAKQYPWVKLLHRPKPMGQSAAMYAGIQAATGTFIATLDADLQNDPADLPKMLAMLQQDPTLDMVQGDRSANRQDTPVRQFSSWVGRTARKLLLGDTIRDTGCSARVVKSPYAKQFPMQYKGVHRFLPFYTNMLGGRVAEMAVHHRPRVSGVAKYGMMNRGLAGLIDCLAVRWMANRYRDPSVKPVSPPPPLSIPPINSPHQ